MFSYSQWLNDLLSKAAGHKYIKRVPYQSGGRMRYRYIYNVTHTHGGKHVLDPDHMKVGTKLMLDATSGAEVHGHIQSVSGDKVTFVYDDGPKKGESVTMSKEKLASELDKVHGISSKLDAARKKQSDVVAKLKEKGASAKQIARAEARLKALGGDTPKAETQKDSAEATKARAILDAVAEAERFNTFNPKTRKRPKESAVADAKLVALLEEFAETQPPNGKRLFNVLAYMLKDVDRGRPKARDRQELRVYRYEEIRNAIHRVLGLEPAHTITYPWSTPTKPTASKIAPTDTAPNQAHSQRTKRVVDQALSAAPTGFDLDTMGVNLPTRGDLKEMLSQEQRLKQAKKDLKSVGALNVAGKRDVRADIMYALQGYLRGPLSEIRHSRLRDTEKDFAIALRDARGEELAQVKKDVSRFWREWGGEYTRLLGELVTEKTEGEALRKIRPLIPSHALTPDTIKLLDEMQRELDKEPVSKTKEEVKQSLSLSDRALSKSFSYSRWFGDFFMYTSHAARNEQ
jgi:hypothetical protein